MRHNTISKLGAGSPYSEYQANKVTGN